MSRFVRVQTIGDEWPTYLNVDHITKAVPHELRKNGGVVITLAQGDVYTVEGDISDFVRALGAD